MITVGSTVRVAPSPKYKDRPLEGRVISIDRELRGSSFVIVGMKVCVEVGGTLTTIDAHPRHVLEIDAVTRLGDIVREAL